MLSVLSTNCWNVLKNYKIFFCLNFEIFLTVYCIFHHGQIIQEGPDELLPIASSTLCNLLLEFSPSKEVKLPLTFYHS